MNYFIVRLFVTSITTTTTSSFVWLGSDRVRGAGDRLVWSGRLGSDRVRGAGDRLVWSGRLGSARVVSRLVHLASDAFPPSLVLGVASLLRVRVPPSQIVKDHTRWTGPSAGSGL